MPRPSTREALLASAIHTFRKHGVRGSTVSELASDASVPVGSVYNHFDSKEALAVQVLNRYAGETDVSMLHGGGRAIDRLREHIARQMARTAATGLGFGCVLANFAGELTDEAYPDLREAVRTVLADWAAALSEVIREAQLNGEIASSRDPEELGGWLVTSLQGATTQAKALDDPKPLATFFSIAFDVVLT